MKFSFAVVLSMVLTVSCLAQDYHFIGLYQKPEGGKSYWCADGFMEERGLANREEYNLVRKAFFEAHKKQSPATHLLTPDDAALVYEVRKHMPGFNCTYNALGLVKGTDEEDAHRQLAKRIAEEPKSYASAPRVVFTWRGSEFKKRVVRAYDGIEITFTSAKASAGKTAIHAQGKNSRTDSTAMVVLMIDGSASGKPILVPPGGRFNHNLGKGEQISVKIRFISHEEASKGVIDVAKSFIKDWITVKEGRMKPEKYFADGERN